MGKHDDKVGTKMYNLVDSQEQATDLWDSDAVIPRSARVSHVKRWHILDKVTFFLRNEQLGHLKRIKGKLIV